jgi:hypothetical protein
MAFFSFRKMFLNYTKSIEFILITNFLAMFAS